ncbi:MAG: hypothetical protein FJX92_05445 [Bacteroidetes bacterium]|nr:hypothetical protein [Bacteroidota bacterium]
MPTRHSFFFLILLIGICPLKSNGQFSRYIVRLKHKGGSTYSFSNPSAFLSPRALSKRSRYSIPIDSLDLPVSTAQLNQLAAIPNLTILNPSKWLNAVSIQTTDPAAINTLNALPFVQSVTRLAARMRPEPSVDKFEPVEETAPENPSLRNQSDYFNYGTGSGNEIRLHQGDFLHNIGLRGQGMHIALLDGGFYNYTTLKAFDSINANNQVLSTWDFVARNASVTEDHPHGMQCLSTIAANIPGQFIGKAPKASFHLFRTEDVANEYPIEEFNWVCGAERADSAGADLISSSVGYYDFDNPTFNYTYAQMNGNTTIAAIGADIGAKKGLLILNSAGNEGGNAWKYIITPADADSILSVGAVNSSGVVGSFSSYGPSSDGQIKPDVASVGVAALVQSSSNNIATANGTSFSCPNMAGLAACLWQGFPEVNNMRIIQVLRESSDRFNNPNDRSGYGIPNLKNAFGKLLIDYAKGTATLSNCLATIQWNSKDIAAMRYEIEQKLVGEVNFTKIGELAAKPGTIINNQSYQFTHSLATATPGLVQFRIRQIIDTTANTYTALYLDTVQVNLPLNCNSSGTNPNGELNAYLAPNPSALGPTYLVIENMEALGSIRVEWIDSKGGRVRATTLNKQAGKQSFLLPGEDLPFGIYQLRLARNNKWIGTLRWMHLR